MFMYDLGFSILSPLFLIGFLAFTLGVVWTGIKMSIEMDASVHHKIDTTVIKKVA